MGFLQNLLYGREIQRLEELIRTAPAPSLFVRLRVLYDTTGNKEKARAIARRGAGLFPESEALTQACADAEKIKNDAEKRRLKARIELFPSPILYARLAELYTKEDDLDGGTEVCRTGCRAYPDYGGLWYVMGKIALARHHIDQGVEYLEKATTLDRYNYNALMLLTEAQVRRGHRDKGRETLEKVFLFAPGDEKATRWLKDFDARAEALEKESWQAAAPPLSPSADPIAAPAAAPPEAMPQARDAKQSSGVGTTLHVAIKEIRRVTGVKGSILIDPYGLVIASDLTANMDENLAGALITNIARTVSGLAKELTLGEFEDGIIDSQQGSIHVLRVDQMTMGVFASPETKAGLLQRAIHTFAESALDLHQ